jgi:hypothetical protein
MSAAVVRAVNEAFEEDRRASFRWMWSMARRSARKALTHRMLKIALDNRLRASAFLSYARSVGLILVTPSQGFIE